MSAKDVAVWVLLSMGVAAVLVCCVGVALAHSTFARLHYASAGSTVGPFLVAGAVVVEEGLNDTALVALLVAALVFSLGAAAAHAVGVAVASERRR